VLFVINKIDLLESDERQEAVAYAKVNLAKLIDEPKVFAISAQRALAGDPASGLGPFVDELSTFLAGERGRVLLDNAIDAALRSSQLLRTGVEVQRRALAMDQVELERRLGGLESDLEVSGKNATARGAKIRESLAAVKALVRKEVEAFGERFAAALPAEIESGKASELKQHLPGFIEDRFRAFADSQAEDVGRRLEKVAEEAFTFLAEDAKARGKKLEELLGEGAPKLDLAVNTFAYDVGVFALGAFGITIMALSNVFVGGAMALAAPVLAWVFRGRADKEVKRRASEEAPKAIKEAASKMADGFDAQIDRFGDRLIEFVTKASEEMVRSIAEVVRTARAARQQGDAASQKLEQSAGMALARLGAIDQRLQTARQELWAPEAEA
jgi:hypothetical protein